MDNKALMVGAGLFALLVGVLLLLAIVQMLFRGKLRLPGGRTRQARLGIVDAFDLDRQRQLIIVRRDNTEHLIMIGGPNDLLIEAEISRVDARESRRDKFEAVASNLATSPGFTEPRILAPYAPVPERLEPQTRLPDVAPQVRSAPVPPAAAPAVTTLAAPAAKPATASAPTVAPAPKPPVDVPPMAAAPPPPVATAQMPSLTAAPLPAFAAASPQGSPLSAAAPQTGFSRPDADKRPPAFPLPPRRPLMPAEPRPASKPQEADKLSNSATASVDAAAAPVSASTPAAAPAPARVPPQFLRPLPPRPALKPGIRPGSEPVPPPASQPGPAPAPDPHNETLESLEEEMAKLLGRGAGEG